MRVNWLVVPSVVVFMIIAGFIPGPIQQQQQTLNLVDRLVSLETAVAKHQGVNDILFSRIETLEVAIGITSPFTSTVSANLVTSTRTSAIATATPPPSTVAPALSTTTLQKAYLVYDYCDTRGYMMGCDDTSITVSKLPVVTTSSAMVEIPFGDISHITMQPSKRQHPRVEHWEIDFIDATITLKNEKIIRGEIGLYLPLPASGDKPAKDVYTTMTISDVYLSGEMDDTGLMAKISMFEIKEINIDASDESPDSLGTVIIGK